MTQVLDDTRRSASIESGLHRVVASPNRETWLRLGILVTVAPLNRDWWLLRGRIYLAFVGLMSLGAGLGMTLKDPASIWCFELIATGCALGLAAIRLQVWRLSVGWRRDIMNVVASCASLLAVLIVLLMAGLGH